MRCLALLSLLLPLPALADVTTTVDWMGAGYARFADATVALDKAAAADCAPDALRPAFHAAYDAWLAVGFFRIGPVDTDGRALALLFWPDPKGLGAKAQRGLMQGDPAALSPDAFGQQSVAARGLAGLERLLHGGIDGDTCPLIRATAHDLARMAAGVAAEWPGYATRLKTAGAAANADFLTPAEAQQALFTQAVTGLEFVAEARIGRPLGTFDKPRPERAEGRASGRSVANIVATLQAIRGFVLALHPDLPRSTAALDKAILLATAMDDPDLSGIADPQGWLKLEILQQSVRAAREALVAELAPALGVGLGFNAQDGD